MSEDEFHELLGVVDATSAGPTHQFDRVLRQSLRDGLDAQRTPRSSEQNSIPVRDEVHEGLIPESIGVFSSGDSPRPQHQLVLAAALVALLVGVAGLLLASRDGQGVVATNSTSLAPEPVIEESELLRLEDPDRACERLAETAPSLQEMMRQLNRSAPVADRLFAEAELSLVVLVADFEASDLVTLSQRNWVRTVLGSVAQSREENRLGEHERAAASLAGVVNQLGLLPEGCELALFAS